MIMASTLPREVAVERIRLRLLSTEVGRVFNCFSSARTISEILGNRGLNIMRGQGTSGCTAFVKIPKGDDAMPRNIRRGLESRVMNILLCQGGSTR